MTYQRLATFGLLFLALFSLTECGQKQKSITPPTPRIGERPPAPPEPAEEEDAGYVPPATTKFLWAVPIAAQSTNYSCGAAAMQSVLGYFGHVHTEEHLMKEMGSTAKEGTDHHKMAAFANKIGVKAEVKHNVPLTEIAAALAKDQAVVIECQAHDERPNKDWANIWDAGHYMVVIGLDDQNIYFMDPSVGGVRGYIPIPEFMTRWHDLGDKGAKLQQTAIFFDAKPNPLPLPMVWSKVP